MKLCLDCYYHGDAIQKRYFTLPDDPEFPYSFKICEERGCVDHSKFRPTDLVKDRVEEKVEALAEIIIGKIESLEKALKQQKGGASD